MTAILVTRYAKSGVCSTCRRKEVPTYDRSRRLCASCTVKALTFVPGDSVTFTDTKSDPLAAMNGQGVRAMKG